VKSKFVSKGEKSIALKR